jgi:outer membrane protein
MVGIMKFINFLAVVVLASLLSLSAAHADQLSALEQIIQKANSRDPRVTAKRLELQAVQEKIVQAKSGYYPQVEGIGEYGSYYYEDPLQRDGDRSTFGVQASQLLYDFGKTSSKIDQARELVIKLEWNLESLTQEIAMETINAYLAYHESVQIRELHEKNHANLLEQLHAVKEEVEAGLNLITNLKLVEARSDLAEARLEQATTQVHQRRITLERLAGPLPDELLHEAVVSPKALYNFPDTIEQALDLALQNYPEINAVKSDVYAAQALHAQAKAELYPSVHAKGMYQAGSFGDTEADAASAHIVVGMPIFQGGMAWSKIREAKKTVQQKEQIVSATQERLEEEVKVVWSEMHSLSLVEKAWRRSMVLEQSALDGIREQVQHELAPLRDLLEAQEDVVQKEMEYKKIIYQNLAAQFRLVQLVAGDWLVRL